MSSVLTRVRNSTGLSGTPAVQQSSGLAHTTPPHHASKVTPSQPAKTATQRQPASGPPASQPWRMPTASQQRSPTMQPVFQTTRQTKCTHAHDVSTHCITSAAHTSSSPKWHPAQPTRSNMARQNNICCTQTLLWYQLSTCQVVV